MWRATAGGGRPDSYYLASFPPDAAMLQLLVRGHWGIENRWPWVMDVVRDSIAGKRVCLSISTLETFLKLDISK